MRDGRRWVDPRSTGRVGQMRVVQGLRLGAMELVGTSASAADRGGRISSPVHALGPESDGDGVRHRRGGGAAQRRGAEAAALEGARCVALGWRGTHAQKEAATWCCPAAGWVRSKTSATGSAR